MYLVSVFLINFDTCLLCSSIESNKVYYANSMASVNIFYFQGASWSGRGVLNTT